MAAGSLNKSAVCKKRYDPVDVEARIEATDLINKNFSWTGETKSALESNYCQAYRQLLNVPSSQLCVRLAAGGDPTYAFNVRLTGEEVHGTSKSFDWTSFSHQIH